MDEEAILVCAPADAPLTVKGSAFGFRCVSCAAEVMIAPSGQKLLKRYRNIRIMCLPCAEKEFGPHPDVALGASAGEIVRELRTACYNVRQCGKQ